MFSTRSSLARAVAGVLLLVGSCATAPAPREAASPRTKDSPSEKVAAHRAAAPRGFELEQNEERWGFDAARERKRQQDAARARQQEAAAGKRIDVTTPPAR